MILRVLLTGALTAGLLAGCGDDDKSATAELDATPTASSTPSASADPDDSADPGGSADPSASPEPGADGFLVEGEDFTVRLPGEPETSEQIGAVGKTEVTYDIYLYEADEQGYTVTRTTYPKGAPLSLRSALDAAAEQADGTLAESRTFTYRGLPAIEGTIVGAEADGKEVVVFARYVQSGRDLIGLIFFDRKKGKNDDFRRFANSLRVSS